MSNRILLISLISLLLLNISLAAFSPCTSYSDLDTEKWRIARDMKSCEKTWNILQNYGNTVAKDTYLFVTETINLDNITLFFAIHDFKNAVVSLDKANTEIIQGTELLNFVFSFEYKYAYIQSGKGIGSATGKVKSYKLTKTWEQLSTTPQVAITVEIDSASIVLKGDYQEDTEVIRLATVGLKAYFKSEINAKLGANLSAEVNQFYLETAKNNKWTTSSRYPEILFGINVDTNNPPKNLEKGVVYYNNFNVDIGPLLKDDPVTWDSFDEADGAHQIFFHQTFFQGIIAELTKNNRFLFNLSNTSKPASIQVALDVETIGNFYPGNDFI